MTPTLCLITVALAIGVPTAVALLLWSACALAGHIDERMKR